jgi:rhamnosyltransferase
MPNPINQMTTDSEITKNNICAVMVIYHPEPEVIAHATTVMQQCGALAIVSNGCSDDIKGSLIEIPGLIWIDSPQNNLAMAQNMGIQYAKQADFTFVLLLDQDSRLSEDMVAQLLAAYTKQPDKERIGIVAPHVTERHSTRGHDYMTPAYGVLFKRLKARPTQILSPVMWVIASGSLIPLSVFDAVGMMDTDYGIDYVDKEFCLRLISRGFRIMVVGDARLGHAIGRCEDHNLAGWTVTATNHPPERRYTIYRNRLRTISRYGLLNPSFLLYECAGISYDLMRIALFEKQKKAKFIAIGAGARAALLGDA